MKFKKLYTCFTCYLTLIAFIGVLSIDVSNNSDYLHKKTEVNSSKTNTSTNFDLVFEEESDTDDLINYTFLSPLNFNDNSLNAVHLINYSELKNNTRHIKLSYLKNPLFLNYRVLRI